MSMQAKDGFNRSCLMLCYRCCCRSNDEADIVIMFTQSCLIPSVLPECVYMEPKSKHHLTRIHIQSTGCSLTNWIR